MKKSWDEHHPYKKLEDENASLRSEVERLRTDRAGDEAYEQLKKLYGSWEGKDGHDRTSSDPEKCCVPMVEFLRMKNDRDKLKALLSRVLDEMDVDGTDTRTWLRQLILLAIGKKP
jgi:hypothetical protein